MAEFQLKARQRARKLCLQALYQWHMTQAEPLVIVQQFEETQPIDKMDRAYFDALFHGVIAQRDDLDTDLSKVMDRPLEALDPVEHAVLRMGAYELKHCLEVPYRVVIHESCRLETQFGANEGHQYINAVLDKLAATYGVK